MQIVITALFRAMLIFSGLFLVLTFMSFHPFTLGFHPPTNPIDLLLLFLPSFLYYYGSERFNADQAGIVQEGFRLRGKTFHYIPSHRKLIN